MYVEALVVEAPTPPLLSAGTLADNNGPELAKADGTVMKCGEGLNVPLIATAQTPNLVKKEFSVRKESERAAGFVESCADNNITTDVHSGTAKRLRLVNRLKTERSDSDLALEKLCGYLE